MVLEATMICIDNSDYMRNGDFSPSRFQAQADAVNLIIGSKTQSNPENSVGVLMMAGKSVRVLLTPTTDLGKLFGCLHGQQQNLGGEVNLTAAIHVAQLALKHRQNKNQKQRIIVFAGSRVDSDEKDLVKIGNNLRKNSVAIDVINFGEEDDQEKELKLTALVDAVNKNNNTTSHIINVPSGPDVLSDVLLNSPIFMDGEAGGASAFAAAAAATGGAGFEFGVDPNMDPELVLALRISMEEERARQEISATSPPAEEKASVSQDVDLMDEDENALLQQALAISMEEHVPSVNESPSEEDMSKVLDDQSYMSSILTSLPGVDPNDPSVRDLLASMQDQSDEQKMSEDKATEEEEKK